MTNNIIKIFGTVNNIVEPTAEEKETCKPVNIQAQLFKRDPSDV